jgi:hypothetical protein
MEPQRSQRNPPTLSPPPLRDCVTIRHARESGHPGIWNYLIKRQLDSGACPGHGSGVRRNDGSLSQLRHNLLRGEGIEGVISFRWGEVARIICG